MNLTARCVLIGVVSLMLPAGAVAQQPGADAPAAVTPLPALVAELERSNPELAAARRDVDMRVARVAPAGALPDPTLSASSMTGFSRPPFFPSSSTPDAFRMVSVAQEVPYPGKRDLRTSVAEADVAAERFNFEDRRRRLIADFKDVYLEYVMAVRSRELLEDSRTLLDELRTISESRFSVGKGVQQDVVKAQLEVSMLLERQVLLDEQRRTLAAQIDTLLFRSPGGDALPAVYRVVSVPADLAELQARIAGQYAALQRDERLIDKARQGLTLARRELKPDFRVGVSAQRYAGDMPWMYGVDFMISLPVYAARKQRPMIDEAAAGLDATQRMRDRDRTMAAAAVAQAFAAITAADRLVALYTDSVLPQSRLALESSLAAYQTGTVDFLSVLTNYQAVVAAQIARLEQQTRRDRALVRLEPYVGIEFIQ